VYCVYSIAQLGPNWAKQSPWLQFLIVNSAIFLTDSWFLLMEDNLNFLEIPLNVYIVSLYLHIFVLFGFQISPDHFLICGAGEGAICFLD
jgi:hypothetical protein